VGELNMVMTTVATAMLGEAPVVGDNGDRGELGF
jgi:hypothetical protein